MRFQQKNPDLLARNLDFLLKNVDFITKQRADGRTRPTAADHLPEKERLAVLIMECVCASYSTGGVHIKRDEWMFISLRSTRPALKGS